jgi:hypothetical protein
MPPKTALNRATPRTAEYPPSPQWRFGSRAACITLAGTSILLRNVSRIENVVARVATLDPFWGYEAKCHLQVLMLCICNFV